jgi:hypothetical protein
MSGTDRDLLIAAAPGVDSTGLADWARDQDGVALVTVTPLGDIGDDPVLGFADGRVIIALRSGDLLLPSSLAGAEVLLQRPEGSWVIVATEAERIKTEADLAAVQRAIEGGLLGRSASSRAWLDAPEGDDARQAGFASALDARGWLLFARQDPAPLLAGRVSADTGILSRWLAAPPQGQQDLAGQRTAYAAAAEDAERAREIEQRDSDEARLARRHARVLPQVRESVAGLRKRVLGHLDTQSASLRRELVASLSTLRSDLVSEAASVGDPDALTALVRDRESRWREDASRQILLRNQAASKAALAMLDTVDWDLVREILGPPGGIMPDAVGLALRPDKPTTVTGHSDFAAPDVGPEGWSGRGAVIGGGLAAGGLIAVGVTAVIPVVGAAAVAAAAGGFAGMASGQLRRLLAAPQQQESVTAAINAEFDALIDLVTRELDRSAHGARDAADEQFAALDRLLAGAAARLAGEPARPGGTQTRGAGTAATHADRTQTGTTAPWAAQDEGTGHLHG